MNPHDLHHNQLAGITLNKILGILWVALQQVRDGKDAVVSLTAFVDRSGDLGLELLLQVDVCASLGGVRLLVFG